MSTKPKVRVREPLRDGREFVVKIGEDSLPPDHPARLLWIALGHFDLRGFVEDARSVEAHAGRDVYSPRMMLTLWGYALHRGIVHARKIERAILTDADFRWITGDMTVKHTRLSSFLVDHREAMLDLLSDVLGALMDAGLLFLPSQRLCQDGTKVAANAGRGSFHDEEGLRRCREQARLHLTAVMARMDDPPPTEREQLASERAAAAMVDRVEQALARLPEEKARKLESHDKSRQTQAARVSTTDPEARVMKVGAYGPTVPAYNLQLATVGDPHGGAVTVVGVRVDTTGNDRGSVWGMREQIACTAGLMPIQVVVDSDHVGLEDVRRASRESLDLISTVPSHWHATSAKQDATTRAWMARMESSEAHEIYRGRKALSERPNAIVKTMYGLRQLPVRGQARIECLTLLMAIMIDLYEHQNLWLN